jgi:hypothetical protein
MSRRTGGVPLDLFSARNPNMLYLSSDCRMTQGSIYTHELKQMIHGDVEEIVGFGSVYHV